MKIEIKITDDKDSPLDNLVLIPSPDQAVEAAGILFPNRKGLIQRFRERIVERVVEQGGDREKAVAVVAEFGDGTLLRMILENLDDIVLAILKLIALFG